MTDLLAEYGFVWRGRCNCAGPRTDKYKNGDYTLYWNKRSKVFRLKQYGKALTTLQPETNAHEILKKYFPQVIPQEV